MKRILFIFVVLTFLGTVNIFAQTEIWTAGELDNIRSSNITLSSDYIQMTDITLAGDWDPIGTESVPFTGTYNGNGYEIIGLNSTIGGLFGVTEDAFIMNVALNNISIATMSGTVGGLVGHAKNTRIENCYTGPFGKIEQLDISGGGGDVGGLVGILEGTALGDNDEFISYIKNSYNQVTVSGDNRVGGLVGSTLIWPNGLERYSWIYRCYNIGPVVDSDKVGGLIGMNAEGSKIEECWSANTVQAEQQVGGLVGINYGHILNCYSICGRPVIGDYVGGLVGVNYASGVVENCYSSRVVQLAGEMQHPGGLIGWGAPGQTPPPPTEPSGYGEVINSYWCVERSGVDSLGYSTNYDILYLSGKLGAARTQDEMAVQIYATNTYVTWQADWYDDNPYIWEATLSDGPSLGYPVLADVPFVWNCHFDVPLPVELSSFTAIVISTGAVNLEWRAETETNVLGYNVYRSEYNDLGDAVKINGPVIIANNSSTPSNYSFLDEEIIHGSTYYYWLESVDLDLSNAFHGPVSVLIAYDDDDDDNDIPEIPLVTELIGAYPNPFNPGTHIKFSLEETSSVTIVIYNVRGQYVKTLASNREFEKGRNHTLFFDGKNHLGKEVKSGVYFYIMTTEDYREVKKMLLLK